MSERDLAATTTLAQRLSEVFRRFDKEIPAAVNDSTTVIATWRKTLKLQGASDLTLLGHVGSIAAGLTKVQAQVVASKSFSSSYRAAANTAIQALSPLLAFERMMNYAKDMRGACNESTYGTLGMVGLALSVEFSEPRFEPADAEEISASLVEIKGLIEDAALPLDLRFDLITQIEQMLIWLADLDLASSREVYEKLGSATFTAALAKDVAKNEDESVKRSDILQRIIGVTSKVAQIVRAGGEAVGGFDKLAHDVHHLLSGPPVH